MTRREEAYIEIIASEYQLDRRTIACLLSHGLLHVGNAERLLIRHRVEAMTRRGAGRCEAMWHTAEELHCSYEKVRAAIYQKNILNF